MFDKRCLGQKRANTFRNQISRGVENVNVYSFISNTTLQKPTNLVVIVGKTVTHYEESISLFERLFCLLPYRV